MNYNKQQMAEMEARKQRSIAQLRAEGVPYIDWLPLTDAVDHVALRMTDEVARRAMCLFVVATGSYTELTEKAREWMKVFEVEADLTPSERQLIFCDPSDQERLQASWRFEAAIPLFWYIGLVPKLDRPDHIADVEALARTVCSLKPDKYYARATNRDVAEVLDRADLIYRYHWATRNAELQGTRAPAGLHGGVVAERHHALNWLIGYPDRADWDDVTTDT